ncbi:hypothetical protein AXF42_Ash017933 [Apostasia shenzhenica]|uniref:Integrase catalytic domain-containing protein n=1 Tax=Apostasia shenzhenica TaxID=1088818 RepID=A0A2I0AY97_9ASPA|nr:hypothetical protein AXF42_Ash017933 [Apostasia shenzhenica]
MNFVCGLPKSKGFDAIWVIVDRLTKSAHFLLIKMTHLLEHLAKLYIDEIMRLHGIPTSIISDRDPRFASRLWSSLQKAMGTKLSFSIAYHSETDGQSERTIQTLEDMLRACAMDFEKNWKKYLPLVEFSHNNSYHASIRMAPYEALYGRKCRSPLYWDEVGERRILGPEIIEVTLQKIKIIRERLLAAQSRQKAYADTRRRDIYFETGEHVFLKVSPRKRIYRFGIKGKLKQKYIGPFEIIRQVGKSAYELALPPELAGIHNVFHISSLRKYVADPNHVLKYEPLNIQPDLSYEEKPVKILDRKEKVLRKCTIPIVKILWRNQMIEEATWETEESMKNEYPHLFR